MRAIPDETTLRAALSLATRAPSIHNTQPWRWRLAEDSLHLYADPDRLLRAADPDGRDLLLSCGAVLHHLRVALAAVGWTTTVHRFPEPDVPDHLAAVGFEPRTSIMRDVALVSAIPARRTDRRRFSSWMVSTILLGDLGSVAARQDAVLVAVTSPKARHALVTTIAAAAADQEADIAYAVELAVWAGRDFSASDGVPATNIPARPVRHDDVTMRSFPNGLLPRQRTGREADAGELLVLATAEDSAIARLRAGEAMSSVLLWATEFGLATCPLSQVLDVPETRALVGDKVLDGFGYPQIVLRVGWAPVENHELPPTPRRDLDEVLSRM